MGITKLADLSVELFYEIFIYFQYHEVSNIFSNLNRRFVAIVNNMPLMPIYLGLNGMSIALAEFYYRYLSQSNIYNCLISLCVSDKITIDNGLWLASHLSTFINLRHLSLIDIKRSSFELILNRCLPNRCLVIFSVGYSLLDYDYHPSVYTFAGVPEGAYYEQIFRLFPCLHICDLRFWRCMYKIAPNEMVLPLNKTFIPIQTRLFNLQKLVLRQRSLAFLLHLLEHHPQLQELSFELTKPWLPDEHPLLMNYDNHRTPAINKSLVPNLCRLKIMAKYSTDHITSLDRLFDRDVLFSLTNMTLLGRVTGPDAVHNILSMLNHQCSYTLMISWYVETDITLLNTNTILLKTLRQLKGRIPIELNLSLYTSGYSIEAFTTPRIDRSLADYKCLNKNAVCGQSSWSSKISTLNHRWARVNHIDMSSTYCKIDDEFFSYLPTIVSWHQITSMYVGDPLNLEELRFIFSKMINLRNLRLHYYLKHDSDQKSNEQRLIKFFNDTSLCNILMANGLKKIFLYTNWEYSNSSEIVSLMVKRLPCLQIVEISINATQIVETLHIPMNEHPKLNLIIFHANFECKNQVDSIICDLQKHSKRGHRIEFCNLLDDYPLIYVWL